MPVKRNAIVGLTVALALALIWGASAFATQFAHAQVGPDPEPTIQAGVSSCDFGALSGCTISHDLGVAPEAVLVQMNLNAGDAEQRRSVFRVGSKTETDFRVYRIDSSTGLYKHSGTLTLHWSAFADGSSPSEPPSEEPSPTEMPSESETPTEQPTESETPTEEPSETACLVPGGGAPQGATVDNDSENNYSSTQVVSERVFTGNAGDDLVRALGTSTTEPVHVTFRDVTFAGSANAHLLEVGLESNTGAAGDNVSVELDCVRFTGDPEEDHTQIKGNGDSVIRRSTFESDPTEDNVDVKAGGDITVEDTTFGDFNKWCLLVNNGQHVAHFRGNTCSNGGMYFHSDSAVEDGSIVGNEFGNGAEVWIDDAVNTLVEGNTFGARVRHGGNGVTPTATYFLNNTFNGSFAFNGGTCFKDGNTGNALAACTSGPPGWYP